MDQDAWDRLFGTDGYAKYLASNRSGTLRAMIQEAVLVAFSPDRHAEADSLLTRTADEAVKVIKNGSTGRTAS